MEATNWMCEDFRKYQRLLLLLVCTTLLSGLKEFKMPQLCAVFCRSVKASQSSCSSRASLNVQQPYYIMQIINCPPENSWEGEFNRLHTKT